MVYYQKIRMIFVTIVTLKDFRFDVFVWFLENISIYSGLMFGQLEITGQYLYIRDHSRFFDCLVHPNLSATLATDQKWPLSCLCISYQSLAECH